MKIKESLKKQKWLMENYVKDLTYRQLRKRDEAEANLIEDFISIK